jgi:hypothetical protein
MWCLNPYIIDNFVSILPVFPLFEQKYKIIKNIDLYQTTNAIIMRIRSMAHF